MRILRLLTALLAALLVAGCGSMNVISDGADSRLMLKGYDPVAFFTQGKPVPGKPELRAEHDGVSYRFSSEEHRRLFLASPAKYVPQYGGFCANGMVYAIPLGGEVEQFKIVNGRLFMFGGLRSKLYFEMDQDANLKLADGYWASEVRDSNWRLQSWKRVWFAKVPHYKTNAELAAEYERRTGRKP